LLSWSIFHGPNKICIEKASGFQSFIIGLAMRIALTKIGAAQFYSKQFFIDEGFSSCDREHLDSIQQFIRNLLHLYDSIILVSHLEEIKDSCDLIVSINQNNYKISSLQF
jgi:exonuclease SbcC